MAQIAIRLSTSIGHIALLSIDARCGIETVLSQLLQHGHQESQTAPRNFTNRPDASKMQDARPFYRDRSEFPGLRSGVLKQVAIEQKQRATTGGPFDSYEGRP
jgi:hypothetical protein